MANFDTYQSKKTIRNVILVIIAIVVLLAVWLLPDRGGSDLVRFSAVDEKVDRLVFTGKDEIFTLEMEGEEWILLDERFPVNKKKVEDTIAFVSEDMDAEVVSSVEIYQPYGLDEDSQLKVEFYFGDKLLRTVRVGNSANRFGNFYGMIDDDSVVYQISFDRYKLDYKKKEILDLNVFDFSPPEIVKISLYERNGKSWELNRVEADDNKATNQTPKEKVWRNAKGITFPKEKINDIINTMSNLVADDISNQNLNTDLPLRKIELSDKKGDTYRLDIINKEDDGYWVKPRDKEYFYQISTSAGEKLLYDISS